MQEVYRSDIVPGMVVGLVIRVTPGRSIQDSVSFDYQFFFNLLLPPIILASGYELHQVCNEYTGIHRKTGAAELTWDRQISFAISGPSSLSPSLGRLYQLLFSVSSSTCGLVYRWTASRSVSLKPSRSVLLSRQLTLLPFLPSSTSTKSNQSFILSSLASLSSTMPLPSSYSRQHKDIGILA